MVISRIIPRLLLVLALCSHSRIGTAKLRGGPSLLHGAVVPCHYHPLHSPASSPPWPSQVPKTLSKGGRGGRWSDFSSLRKQAGLDLDFVVTLIHTSGSLFPWLHIGIATIWHSSPARFHGSPGRNGRWSKMAFTPPTAIPLSSGVSRR